MNPQAALELLVLKTLATGPQHGFGIALHIEEASSALLRVEEGSLYPALHRLEIRGEVTSEMTPSENNRRARVYTITTAGRRRLKVEQKGWEHFALSMRRVLETE